MRVTKQLFLLFFFLLLALLSGFKLSQLSKNKSLSFPFYEHWPAPLWEAVTLGFKDFFDELLFLGFIADLADSEETGSYEALSRELKAFSHLNPRIESFYTLSCFVFLFEKNNPSFCLSLLEQGAKALPNSWRVPLTQGYVWVFQVGDFVKGAHYYEAASKKKGAPSYLKKLAESLLLKKFKKKNQKFSEDILFPRRGE